MQFIATEEEISNMRRELEKYGLHMPAFNKIGGILANELSVDEAACKQTSLIYSALLLKEALHSFIII